MVDRRQVITGGSLAAALSFFGARRTVFAQTAFPTTAETLHKSRESEMNAHHQYAAFTRQAKADGYPGIAYLFTALATAELIHAQNFEKILARMGSEILPLTLREIEVQSTRQNLMRAAADELNSVSTFYPDMLKQLEPEGFQDAVTVTTHAWETEKQHLGILKKIERWTPKHFETVAKKIENETGQYFVCQNCGATTVEMPQEACPICQFPSENYRKIDPPV